MSFFRPEHPTCPHTPTRNEEHAKEALMSIPDDLEREREPNTSAISSWSPHAAHSLLLQALPAHPAHKKQTRNKLKKLYQRNSIS